MASIAVLSSLALKGVLEEFKPSFERSLGTALELRSLPDRDAAAVARPIVTPTEMCQEI